MNDRPPGRIGPERDAPDRQTGATTTTRLGGGGRGPAIVSTLIVAFVAVALLKPWPGPGTPRPTPRIPTVPAPVATVDPLADLRLHCQEPLGWRIFSQERWLAMTVRSWRSLQPAYGAKGPLDPAIPIVPIVARLDGLGYCSPWTQDQRPPDAATVDGWQIVAPVTEVDGRNPGATAANGLSLHPLIPGWATVLGALYAPPGDGSASHTATAAVWPVGRYVFAVRAPGYQRWWGVDLQPPSDEPSSYAPASRQPAGP